VYTRTGDGGEACLYNMERRSKDDLVFQALGDTDELNSIVGVAREFCVEEGNGLEEELATIQSRLLDVGSAVATPIATSTQAKLKRASFPEGCDKTLEERIDAMDEELPALANFILPSGGRAASFLHLARTVCRRAERAAVPLARDGQLERSVVIFLNRLSDYLFTAARYAALKAGKPEVAYKKA